MASNSFDYHPRAGLAYNDNGIDEGPFAHEITIHKVALNKHGFGLTINNNLLCAYTYFTLDDLISLYSIAGNMLETYGIEEDEDVVSD